MDPERDLLSLAWEALRCPVMPGRRAWLALGWWLALLFGIAAATGILLSFYYEPLPGRVAGSVRHLAVDVAWGWLFRGVHHWAGQGLIALALLQMLRVFLTGAYRGPRASSWYLGLAMLAAALLLASTGEILAWDERARWLAGGAMETVTAVPLVGPALARILFGGEEVGSATLGRAWAAHGLFLTWLVMVLLLAQLWLLARRRRAGGAT